MNLDLEKGYFTEVLGFKTLPEGSLWTAEDPQATQDQLETQPAKQLFGVYIGQALSPEGADLVQKMLKAIGQSEFPILDRQEDFLNFEHILDFSGEQTAFSKASGRWSFSPIQSYLSGPSDEVATLKKKAWEFLKQFRSEVMS